MFSWKRFGIALSLSLTFIIAACGSADEETQAGADVNVSEELEYTITGIEPGAGQTETNEVAIEEYDSLTGWEQELSSGGAMVTQLGEAIDNEEPIIVSAWSPHYKFANWDLKYLDDPQGVFGEDESIRTLTRLGLEEDKPEAYTILDRLYWELEDVEEALLKAQEDEFEVVAEEWAANNEEIIAEWLDGVEPVNGESIELVYTSWDAETFITFVAGIALEEHGFDVTLTPVDPAIMFEAVASGDADATLSPWMPLTHVALYEEYEGQFEDLGANVEGARIGLAVPEYMEIDSIEDLEPKE